jgi:Flp pilus assembly protein TadG
MTRHDHPRPRAARPRPRGVDRGSASISFAMVFPMVLTVVCLAVQGGMWWWAREVAQTAAREGAAAGRAYGAGAQAGADQAGVFMRQYADGVTFSVPPEGMTATTVTVSVVVTPQRIVPFLPDPTITTSVTSTREVWVHAGQPTSGQ